MQIIPCSIICSLLKARYQVAGNLDDNSINLPLLNKNLKNKFVEQNRTYPCIAN